MIHAAAVAAIVLVLMQTAYAQAPARTDPIDDGPPYSRAQIEMMRRVDQAVNSYASSIGMSEEWISYCAIDMQPKNTKYAERWLYSLRS